MQISRPTNKGVSDVFGNYQTWRDLIHSGTDFLCYDEYFVAPEDCKINEVTDSTIQAVGLNEYETNEGIKVRFTHRFYHLNKPNLGLDGRTFKKGEQIAKSGNQSGQVGVGWHLHWTVVVSWPGNVALCDPLQLSDSGKIVTTVGENGLGSWTAFSKTAQKGGVVPLKTKFNLLDMAMVEELKKQNLTLQTQLNVLQGRFDTLYAESQSKDTQITNLNNSINDLNTRLALSVVQVEKLTSELNKLDGEFAVYRTQSEATQKSLEADIASKQTEIDALTADNKRLQEELRLYKISNVGSGTNVLVQIFLKIIDWIKGLFNKG